MRGRLLFGMLVLCLSGRVIAQEPPAGAASAPPRRPPENLRVLPKDVDPKPQMMKIAQALGVQCSFCHVQGNFASDEYRTKITARRMMQMVKAINEQNFPNHETTADSPLGSAVTCYTCHRGAQKPATAAPAAKPGVIAAWPGTAPGPRSDGR